MIFKRRMISRFWFSIFLLILISSSSSDMIFYLKKVIIKIFRKGLTGINQTLEKKTVHYKTADEVPFNHHQIDRDCHSTIPYNDMNLIAYIFCHIKPVQYCNLNINLPNEVNFEIRISKTCNRLYRTASRHGQTSQILWNI